jgi:hypothetical protein
MKTHDCTRSYIARWRFGAFTLLFICGVQLCGVAGVLKLSPIPDLTTTEDMPTLPVPLGISGDTDRELAWFVTSSNPNLVPERNVVFEKIGDGQNLSITPGANQSGAAVIGLQITDGSLIATQSFVITVTSANDAPTISHIADQIVAESKATSVIPFTIGDVETPGASLMVSAASSDGALLPNTSILLAGSGASRTISMTPAAGKSGIVTITLTVSDGEATASQQFQLLVGTVNRPPLVNAGPDQTLASTNVAVLNGTATDDRLSSEQLLTRWTAVNGTADISFANPEALNTNVRFERPGIYTLSLTASDGDLTGSDDVTIVVAENPMAATQESDPTSR